MLISMVVETVVAAPSGPSATSSTWITMSRPLSAREAVRASRVPRLRSRNAKSWPAKALQTGPAVRERAPLAFAVRTAKMPDRNTGGGEGDDGPSRSTATRDRSPRSRRGALSQLRPQRHHFACASRCARRLEARPAPHPLRHVPEPPPDGGGAAAEVGGHRRRGARQVPPARRPGGLRGDGAHGAALLAPLPAGARRGQLRLARRRSEERRVGKECRAGWARG